MAEAARNAYSNLSREIRTAKQAAASQSASNSRKSGAAAARVWNFVRRWTSQVSVKVTAAILGIMVLVLILQRCVEGTGDNGRVDIAAEHGG